MFVRRFILALLVAVFVPFTVSASESAPQLKAPHPAKDSARALLDHMSHSFRELNYQGTFIFQRGDSMESMRISHAIIDGKEYERLEYMDGKKRDVVRAGHDVNCVHPGHQLLRFYPSQYPKFNSFAQQKNDIDRYYHFDLAGKGRVAGREVVKVKIKAKDSHRFGYHLAIDDQSGLLLSSKLMGNNKVLEHFHFVDIHIGKPLPLEHFNDAGNSVHVEHVEPLQLEAQSQSIPENSWQVNWLPGGFTSVIANLKYITSDMATFTDGLTVFSVFLEKNIADADMAKGLEGSAQRGATTAYSRALLLNDRPHRVTVVGEIPPQTAQRIAQSVAMAGEVH